MQVVMIFLGYGLDFVSGGLTQLQAVRGMVEWVGGSQDSAEK